MSEKIPMTITGKARGGTYMCDEVRYYPGENGKPGIRVGIILLPTTLEESRAIKNRMAEIIGNSLGMDCKVIE